MKLISFILILVSSTAFINLSFTARSHDDNEIKRLTENQVEAWRYDIDFMQRELERGHIDLYHHTTAEDFHRALDRIKVQLPQLSKSGVLVELMRAIKLVGDGHTQFAYWMGNYHRYPLELMMLDDNLYVVSIDAEYQALLGARLIAVDHLHVDKIKQRLAPLLQGVENSHSARQRISSAITTAEILQGANISLATSQASFEFEQASGVNSRINLRSIKASSFDKYPLVNLQRKVPSVFTKHKKSIEGLAMHFSMDKQTAYIDFQRYPSSSAMQDFNRGLTSLLRKENTRNVIIDLRNNGGGDFFIGLQLAQALVLVDNLNWKNGIYVLIGSKTFSAAMSNAVQFRQLLNATLVGEPTGANPVGYQDAGTFTLPNSSWPIMYSKRLYRFQETFTAGVQPDFPIAPDWESFKAGRDNQLEWILQAIRSEKDKQTSD
jgi:hypothetical protein